MLNNSSHSHNPALTTAAEQFAGTGRLLKILPFGSGIVNETFLITVSGNQENKYILQRINTAVFPQPELIMHNLRVVTDHIRQKLAGSPSLLNRRWEIPLACSAKDGRDCFIDGQGGFWRALRFIDRAVTFETISAFPQPCEAGHALGIFHALISDLEPESLHDTLPGFHITPRYLACYDTAAARVAHPAPTPETEFCQRFIEQRRKGAAVLEDARRDRVLALRAVHGDPKLSNILVDPETRQAVSMIDLDTVKPGLVHYDLGDCLRSCCNPAGEETECWEDVCFEIDLCEQILKGYCAEADCFLAPADYTYIYDAIRLIAFELGLRFFTDFLAGNVYFKTRFKEQNLCRALVQFKLAESIEAQEKDIRALVRGLQ